MRQFAAELQARYPEALLFRVYGRNFVIITTDHFDMDTEVVSFASFRATGVTVESSHVDLLENATYYMDKLENLEILCASDNCRLE
jgi:hypothetical protein